MAWPDLTQPEVRACIAIMRHLHGPVIFEPDGPAASLCRIWLPAMGISVLAIGDAPSLSLEEVCFMVELTGQDAIILRTSVVEGSGREFTFDIVMDEGGSAETLEDYVFCRTHDRRPFFVAVEGDGPAVCLDPDGLVLCDPPWTDSVGRMEGLGRGLAELMMVVEGDACMELALEQG
ncbi:hypothetical protein [Sphingomonas solaris]|uniref:Uncharacterized protein n=1 Tax=Alterirhizorhabdus solaris TaxID=2529389 RepID=A0A558R5Y2_9SPHN|nr:hypothetical protein [Sphingomonas solaris]TVV74748.1 hypothetical protein FOY91_08840 [Sphingomonas solaris]